jgi:hypothetical protein
MSAVHVGEVAKMRTKGKSEEDVQGYTDLVREVIQAINSKQLIPTIRSETFFFSLERSPYFFCISKKYIHTHIFIPQQILSKFFILQHFFPLCFRHLSMFSIFLYIHIPHTRK